ncbi:MAG: hypothetical protein IJO91_03935 [Oscillospiraceae bacterium]|nr:hypothetical protein [Oscillospiraceae bacterium]
MIHTIVSLDDVFASHEAISTDLQKTSNGYAEYITVNGRRQLRRIISTDPAEYLKAENQPFRYYT